jgi:hypothetical protein
VVTRRCLLLGVKPTWRIYEYTPALALFLDPTNLISSCMTSMSNASSAEGVPVHMLMHMGGLKTKNRIKISKSPPGEAQRFCGNSLGAVAH